MAHTKNTEQTDATKITTTKDTDSTNEQQGGGEELLKSPMMAHLLDALESGTDIGHYGRLTFVMVARHFLSEEELVDLLSQQPDHTSADSRALVHQVKTHDYNPPKRDRILQWQSEQDFPICPTPDDPVSCNVYRELRFPNGIYENITEFHEEQAEAETE
jgi:hypothetical protein